MANHHAHLACLLELNPHCDACVRHTMEVLYSCDGVYDIEYDAERKTAKIIGEVDPNFCLKALARCGYHATIKHVKMSHPRISTIGAYDPFGSYGHNSYPRYGRGYHDHGHQYPPHSSLGYYGGEPYRRSLSEGMWHDYPARSYNAIPYYGGGGGSSQYYDRSYGGRDMYDYTPYGRDHGMGMCRIM